MSLDKNLFTLIFTPHKDNPNVIDLVDPSGTVHYRKQRVLGTAEYRIELYDPTSESLLAIASAPLASSKTKTIELCNPTCTVELRHTGTLSFKWSFKWEDNEFEWKREECFIVRKPDPPVIISVTKEPAGRLKTTTVQILDYNLNRFDIDDRKGLEIVILTALLTFSDANEAIHTPEGNSSSSGNPLSRTTSVAPAGAKDLPPPPPPKPAPKIGLERVAEMQAMKGEYNEIIISEEGSVADYAAYCNGLLQDDAMLFVSLKSAEAEQVPKVLQVVEETKRIRYKAGLDEEEGLHQYVLYDQKEARKGPRIINLDDDRKNKYAPPKNLTVHLSKIAMPELQPKTTGNDKNAKNTKKEDKKAVVPQAPQPRRPTTPPSTNIPSSSSSKPPIRLQRPPKQTAPQKQPQQQVDQTRISPSQLNNPGLYASPRPYKGSRPPRPSDPPYPSGPSPDGGRRPNQPSLNPNMPHQNSKHYLRAPSPNIPGAWTPSPSHTPPPPEYAPPLAQSDEKGNPASHGASTMVQGFLGLISTGKLK